MTRDMTMRSQATVTLLPYPALAWHRGQKSHKRTENSSLFDRTVPGNDEDETVNARYVYASHLVMVSAAAHGKPRLKSIIKGSDKSKLSNYKHEKTVIDLGKCGFGLGDELFLFGIDLISVNVVCRMSSWVGVGCLCVDLKRRQECERRNKQRLNSMARLRLGMTRRNDRASTTIFTARPRIHSFVS
jgi:hypothetical protein